MPRPSEVPLPVISAWDPRATAAGSLDPLGALRPYGAIAGAILPGVTTITTRVRYLSWVCAGLRLLDELPDAPLGGRAGRARRARLLGWERLLALATGLYARSRGATEGDPVWGQLRGVTYVRRAMEEGTRAPDFPMLRNQAGMGGIGTYWVALVAGGLAEDTSGALTRRGARLADCFLEGRSTPRREPLREVLRGQAPEFEETTLWAWGKAGHLAAAGERERQLLADALLEPPAQRRMADAMGRAGKAGSDAVSFEAVADELAAAREPLSSRLAAVLRVAIPFEALHAELLYRFDLLRAAGAAGRPVPLAGWARTHEPERLARGEADLAAALVRHRGQLPPAAWGALEAFRLALQPVCRAGSAAELARGLVLHHRRVQEGKLDAARQPKRPWVELDPRQENLVVAPRYVLLEPPVRPEDGNFTHPYRLVQFWKMLQETQGRSEGT